MQYSWSLEDGLYMDQLHVFGEFLNFSLVPIAGQFLYVMKKYLN